jgi:hypothetical protein
MIDFYTAATAPIDRAPRKHPIGALQGVLLRRATR